MYILWLIWSAAQFSEYPCNCINPLLNLLVKYYHHRWSMLLFWCFIDLFYYWVEMIRVLLYRHVPLNVAHHRWRRIHYTNYLWDLQEKNKIITAYRKPCTMRILDEIIISDLIWVRNGAYIPFILSSGNLWCARPTDYRI